MSAFSRDAALRSTTGLGGTGGAVDTTLVQWALIYCGTVGKGDTLTTTGADGLEITLGTGAVIESI